MICTIPKANIRKAGIYVNSGKMTMAQVKKALGCQYIINGGLFNMSAFTPACYLTIDGQIQATVGNPYGFAIKDDKMVFSYGNNVKYPGFLGCYHVLVRNGAKAITRSESNKYGYTNRSVVGLMPDGSIVMLCDPTNRSLYGMAEDLAAMGCEVALNYDGGGSSQCDFDGETVTSSRIVHNFICVWTQKENNPSEDNEPMNILLIAGHGAGDPGATSKIGSKSYQEAQETRTLVSLIAKSLKPYANVEVYSTDRNAYEDACSGAIGAYTKFSKYKYVLEVHFNAYKKDAGDGKTKGVEIYVTTSEKGTGVEEAICKNIAALGFNNRGVKRKNWTVISKAKADGTSSALLETCFIDDADDMALYAAKRTQVAQAIAAGIAEGFGLKADTDPAAVAKKIIREKAGLSEKTMEYLAAYEYGDDLLVKLAEAMK